MTSGAERLRELRALMDADLERFRERLAEARQLSEDLAGANPAVDQALTRSSYPPDQDEAPDYRPATWLV
ncbi:hypothetical protein [Rhodococcus sp. NPDC058521]|uniref:hypothetical protein n=1 Tax=Rhodococcus sp. NPDC058521 TaxID=3346536 RepID=UPI003646C071